MKTQHGCAEKAGEGAEADGAEWEPQGELWRAWVPVSPEEAQSVEVPVSPWLGGRAEPRSAAGYREPTGAEGAGALDARSCISGAESLSMPCGPGQPLW